MNQSGKKSKARAKQSGTRVEFRTTQRKKDLIDYYSNKDNLLKKLLITILPISIMIMTYHTLMW